MVQMHTGKVFIFPLDIKIPLYDRELPYNCHSGILCKELCIGKLWLKMTRT